MIWRNFLLAHSSGGTGMLVWNDGLQWLMAWWVVLAVNNFTLVPSMSYWIELLFAACLGGPMLHAAYDMPVASVTIRSVVIPSTLHVGTCLVMAPTQIIQCQDA